MNANRTGVLWFPQRSAGVGCFVTEVVRPISVALGCASELERCRTIATVGTSADAQCMFHAEHRINGRAAALQAVNRWLAATTLADVGAPRA
jgi:hypothetical protein